MHVSDFLDYKTLLTSECVLGIVFTIVFAGIKRIYPQARGAYPVAISFALVIPETIFRAMGGHAAPVVSVLMANTLTLSSLIALYEAILQFTGGTNRRWFLWFLAFSSFAVVYYSTEVVPNLLSGVISVSLAMAAIRVFSALALFQRSVRSTQRRTLQLFGLFLCVMAFISLRLAWNMFANGLPLGTSQFGAQQGMMRATGMFYMATTGLFFLVLTSREVVSRRRLEVQRDTLTGTYNRGSLDLSLGVELDRSSRSGNAFSIGLVEVDQLGRILESEGRAGANATLREVAGAISGRLRGTDQIGRFSGDMFLLILSQTSQSEARIVAERISLEVGKLKLLTGSEPLTLSIGITESVASDTGSLMIERAEEALLQAKSDGRNCARVVLMPLPNTGAATDSTASAVA